MTDIAGGIILAVLGLLGMGIGLAILCGLIYLLWLPALIIGWIIVCLMVGAEAPFFGFMMFIVSVAYVIVQIKRA